VEVTLRRQLPCFSAGCLFLLVATTCYAQSPERAGIGIEFGIEVCLFDYQSPASNWNPESDIGYSVAFTKDFVVSNKFAFESSVNYVCLNSEVEVMPVLQPPNVFLTGGNFRVSQESIDLALLLKVYLQRGVRFYGAFGGQMGFLLSAELEVTEIVWMIDRKAIIQTGSVDITNSMKDNDFSVVLAVGAEFVTVSGPDIRFDLQYTHGVVESTESFAGVRWKRRDIKFTVGLLF
jgi:hypothetical protein